jgi:site-specific DNA-methyltransferase (adenine-specific)
MVEKMAYYANEHGCQSAYLYFSVDGKKSITASEWDQLRYVWHHAHGITNVWSEGP